MYFYYIMSAIIGCFCGYGIAIMFGDIEGIFVAVTIGILYVLSAIYSNQEEQQNREVTAKS